MWSGVFIIIPPIYFFHSSKQMAPPVDGTKPWNLMSIMESLLHDLRTTRSTALYLFRKPVPKFTNSRVSPLMKCIWQMKRVTWHYGDSGMGGQVTGIQIICHWWIQLSGLLVSIIIIFQGKSFQNCLKSNNYSHFQELVAWIYFWFPYTACQDIQEEVHVIPIDN